MVCARPGCDEEFVRVTCQKYCSVQCRGLDKRCTKCRVSIPSLSGTKNRLCLECDAERARAYRKGERYKGSWINGYRARQYGLSPEEFDRILAAQGYACAVCGEEETWKNRHGDIRPLAVDHDHATGRVRALLCHRCNAAIGLLKEDPVRARAAADYLESHKVGVA